jgi:hypothetical protein
MNEVYQCAFCIERVPSGTLHICKVHKGYTIDRRGQATDERLEKLDRIIQLLEGDKSADLLHQIYVQLVALDQTVRGALTKTPEVQSAHETLYYPLIGDDPLPPNHLAPVDPNLQRSEPIGPEPALIPMGTYQHLVNQVAELRSQVEELDWRTTPPPDPSSPNLQQHEPELGPVTFSSVVALEDYQEALASNEELQKQLADLCWIIVASFGCDQHWQRMTSYQTEINRAMPYLTEEQQSRIKGIPYLTEEQQSRIKGIPYLTEEQQSRIKGE